MDEFNPNSIVLLLTAYGKDNTAYYDEDKSVTLVKDTFISPDGVYLAGYSEVEMLTVVPVKLAEVIREYNHEELYPMATSIITMNDICREENNIMDQVNDLLNKDKQ
jgi:hypothetical protein